MSSPAVVALDGLIADLHGQGRLRVWSLAITIFGDAVSPRGGTIALSLLQSIMQRLRIEPGALRTAMSRLAAEGWVKRQKQGRLSFYRFEGGGRHAFDRATRRIYAPGPPQWSGRWTIAIAAPGEAMNDEAPLAEAGFARLANGFYLRAGTETAGAALPGGLMVLRAESGELPGWVSSLWQLQEISEAYRDLTALLQPLARALEGGDGLSGVDAMAARTLLIHHWRRIVLRDPGLPVVLLPADWQGEATRDTVRRIYAHIVPPSEAWLDGAGLAPLSDTGTFSARFGGRE